MDYTNLFNNRDGKKSIVGIVGATRGYGYTLLAQIPWVKNMVLRVICSRHKDECLKVLKETGYDMSRVLVCENAGQVRAAPADAILVVDDYHLVLESDITALVECTGNVPVGSNVALLAMERKINVYMVSKETDSVCGPFLNDAAKDNEVVYALVNGDQPRNLIDLWSWARLLGLEIVAAGKSSEYDFVWDRETGELAYLDGNSEKQHMPEMQRCWYYSGRETLEERSKLLKGYFDVIAADLCEMNLVSNVTGLVPAAPFLNYPVAKISELADIFIPEEDGGILKRTGVVDVFYNLRGWDEASFCGGEFVIVRCKDAKMWDILRGKGHVISRNGKYACLYSPYHYMGMETPASILLGDFMGVGSHPECRQHSVMAGVAAVDLPAGTTFNVHGHHHAIDELTPQLLAGAAASEAAPFYFLNGVTLKRDVKKGASVTLADVDLPKTEAFDMYLKGLEL